MSSKRIFALALMAVLMMVGSAYAGPSPSITPEKDPQLVKDVFKDLSQSEAFVAEAAELFEYTGDQGVIVPPALSGDEMIQIGSHTLSSATWMKLVNDSMAFGWKKFDEGKYHRARVAAEFAKSVSLYLVMYAAQ